MQSKSKRKDIGSSTKPSGPSLLRQIIDEIDELNNEKKKELLWKLKIEKALQVSQLADDMYRDKFLDLSDGDIAELVSKNRKLDYEEKIHY